MEASAGRMIVSADAAATVLVWVTLPTVAGLNFG